MNRSRSGMLLRPRAAPPMRQRPQGTRPLAAGVWSAEARQALFSELLGFAAIYALVVNYLLGTPGAVAFLAASVGLLALAPRAALGGLLRLAPLFALPLLALLSAQWSEAPGATTRAALQILVTAGAAAVVAVRCSERTVVLALFLGLLTVCSTGIPQIPEGLKSGWPIMGAFASKNSFAIHCQFLTVFSLAVAGDRGHGWLLRLFAFLALLLSLVLVYLAKSGGAAILTALTLVLFPALLLFGRMPVWARISVLASASLVALAGVILAPQVTAFINWFRTDVMGKDATLTGRTELWEIADKLVSERPWLGHGYFAFWRLGNPEAEAIWRDFGVGRGGGFNFHNEFVEFSVGLGYVGVGLLVGLCLMVAAAAAYRHITRPSFQSAVALTAMVSIYSRAFVETGLVAPFSIVLAWWMIIASRSFEAIAMGAAVAPGTGPERPRPWRGKASGLARNAAPNGAGLRRDDWPVRD